RGGAGGDGGASSGRRAAGGALRRGYPRNPVGRAPRNGGAIHARPAFPGRLQRALDSAGGSRTGNRRHPRSRGRDRGRSLSYCTTRSSVRLCCAPVLDTAVTVTCAVVGGIGGVEVPQAAEKTISSPAPASDRPTRRRFISAAPANESSANQRIVQGMRPPSEPLNGIVAATVRAFEVNTRSKLPGCAPIVTGFAENLQL